MENKENKVLFLKESKDSKLSILKESSLMFDGSTTLKLNRDLVMCPIDSGEFGDILEFGADDLGITEEEFMDMITDKGYVQTLDDGDYFVIPKGKICKVIDLENTFNVTPMDLSPANMDAFDLRKSDFSVVDATKIGSKVKESKKVEPIRVKIDSLRKKEAKLKSNPKEKYYLYEALNENGDIFSWISKGTFCEGDIITGINDKLTEKSTKLKNVRLYLCDEFDESNSQIDFYNTLLKESKYRLDEMFDEECWRKSRKGQEEREWWMNHCHAEYKNRWRSKKGTENLFASDDAEESIMRYGKFYVDEKTDKPIEVNYVASLLKSWGEPLGQVRESEEKKESEFPTQEIYQVVRTSDLGSSLGEDVSNIEPTVVSEFDCEDCAKAKAEELNQTVTAGEKAVIGTEYEVMEKKILESRQKMIEAIGSQEEEDIRDWVESTLDYWQTSWDDDYDGCSQCAEDLMNAGDWFSNNLDEFEETYGYELGQDAYEFLDFVVEDYVERKIQYMIDTRYNFDNLRQMIEDGNTDPYSYEDDSEEELDDEESEDEDW